MDVFDLKKRAYIGTTSMESEVSLLMANQAQAAPGKVCYDPFGAIHFPSCSHAELEGFPAALKMVRDELDDRN